MWYNYCNEPTGEDIEKAIEIYFEDNFEERNKEE